MEEEGAAWYVWNKAMLFFNWNNLDIYDSLYAEKEIRYVIEKRFNLSKLFVWYEATHLISIRKSIKLTQRIPSCWYIIGEEGNLLLIITGNAINSSIKQSGNHTDRFSKVILFTYGVL